MTTATGRAWLLTGLAITLVAVNALLLPYVRPAMGVTADSLSYLALAQNLLDGNGYHIEGRLFAVWPIGYSTLTAAASWLFGVEPYWGARIANIGAVAVAALALAPVAGGRLHLFVGAFLTASSLAIGQSAWSETAFMAALVALAAFLFRYVGLCALAAIALAGLHHLWRKRWRAFLQLLGAGVAVLVAALAYLGRNVLETGQATGMIRALNDDGSAKLVADLIRAQAFELNPVRLGFAPGSAWQTVAWVVTAVAVAAAAGHVVMRWQKTAAGDAPAPAESEAWPWFLVVGAVYWAAIVPLRWRYDFDDFSHRLLGPSSVLFLMAGLSFVGRRPAAARLAARYWIALLAASVALNVGGKATLGTVLDRPAFPERRAAYAALPPGAVLLYGDELASYVRPDVRVVPPNRADTGAPLAETVARWCRDGATAVHAQVKDYLDAPPNHPSVRAFAAAHRGRFLVEIGRCPVP